MEDSDSVTTEWKWTNGCYEDSDYEDEDEDSLDGSEDDIDSDDSSVYEQD